MRGKVYKEVCDKLRFGITPAHAGKSRSPWQLPAAAQDHPRTCGEKKLMNHSDPAITGSPPHMRGKGSQAGISRATDRITPAHAGKSLYNCVVDFIHQDHPRTCGEKGYNVICGFRGIGSPPHMRGKALPFLCSKSILLDHPRTCGEKMVFAVFTLP